MMKQLIIILIAALLVPAVAVAEITTEMDIDAGVRLDNLDWNIAGNINGTNPDVLSELTWSDLWIVQLRASGKAMLNESFLIRTFAGYGWIVDGNNQDSDYAGPDRTYEFSRSNNSADDGSVLDASIGFGYQFRPRNGRFRIAPLVGYSYHEQNLRMQDGFQTLDPYGIIGQTGPFPGLDSSYDARWMGPWAGIDMSLDYGRKLAFLVSLELHLADYDAEADWNLRQDFAHPVSFTHEADGFGIVTSLGGQYTVNSDLSLGLTQHFQFWTTEAGTDRTYFSDGTIAATQLNEVNWESTDLMLNATYRF
jgi:hypothetical protein